MFTKDDLIHTYTRRQAIRDGVLNDVSIVAAELGLKYPVAFTAGVWSACQREDAWVREVLELLRLSVRAGRGEGPEIRFQIQIRDDTGTDEVLTLYAVCGPDDDGSPCITVMLEGED